MNVLDYIAFKKMGLSSDDIKACINNGIKPDELRDINDAPDNNAANDVINSAAAPEPETAPAAVVTPANDETDYKALYEAEKAKVSKIQQENTKQQMPEEKVTIEDIVASISSHM